MARAAPTAETGLRWGELTELRPSDLDRYSRVLTVSRVVLELLPKCHPASGAVWCRSAIPPAAGS